jgi:S-formylglutathione hydrolase FrmB
VRHAILFLAAASSLLAPRTADANNHNLDRLNAALAGKVVDFTRNHGGDRRIFSTVLGQYRDLYVYLPPGYRADEPCNLIVWFHGAFGDEQIAFFLSRIEVFDRLIACGAAGPTIVVFPDCTVSGLSSPFAAHSFMVNGRAGRFEDHLFQEIVPFVERKYNVKRERDARAIAGISAGGFAALSLGFLHREQFGTIATLGPPANLRYDNVDNKYFEDFNPATYRWRENYRPTQVVGKFFAGLVQLRVGPFVNPIFGPQKETLENVKKYNPTDLLFTRDIQPGEFNLFIDYPKRDNFNFDAHSESFIHFARMKGLAITVIRDEHGHHTVPFFQEQMPTMWKWLARRLPGGRIHPETILDADVSITLKD